MATNIGLLPQISAQFAIVTNGDWRDVIEFTQAGGAPIDLSGIAFRAMVRAQAGDAGAVIDASTANQLLANGGSAGTLSFAVPAAQLAQIPPGDYVMDLLAMADGWQINLFQRAGPATVTIIQGITLW